MERRLIATDAAPGSARNLVEVAAIGEDAVVEIALIALAGEG